MFLNLNYCLLMMQLPSVNPDHLLPGKTSYAVWAAQTQTPQDRETTLILLEAHFLSNLAGRKQTTVKRGCANPTPTHTGGQRLQGDGERVGRVGLFHLSFYNRSLTCRSAIRLPVCRHASNPRSGSRSLDVCCWRDCVGSRLPLSKGCRMMEKSKRRPRALPGDREFQPKTRKTISVVPSYVLRQRTKLTSSGHHFMFTEKGVTGYASWFLYKFMSAPKRYHCPFQFENCKKIKII